MRRRAVIALVAAVTALLIWSLLPQGSSGSKTAVEESPLYSGKEPKLKVRLFLPASEKPGFVQLPAEIYLTPSRVAQLKQLLLQLFAAQGPGAAAAFPAGFRYREVFVTDSGTAVLDLDGASLLTHPGGTSSEFVTLYSMVKSLCDNFRDIKRVQFLVDGQAKETLAGHISIIDPLSLEDF